MSPHARSHAIRLSLNAYERSCWFTGLSWTVVPTLTASTTEQAAQLADVCRIASAHVDSCCRQPLRATVNTETITGPGKGRLSIGRDTGIGSLVTRRWPVAQVLAVQTSPARAFPPVWTPVAASQWSIRYPMLLVPFAAPQTSPSGGNVIDLAPGIVSWAWGPGWWRVQHSYVSGWAHAGTTGMVLAGAETLAVDDVTGWAGASGYLYDGTSTEPVTVSAVTPNAPVMLPNGAGIALAGPGTLTLTSPLLYGHGAGTVLSALPETVLHAAALFAAVQAIQTIDAIATQSLSGEVGSTSMLEEAAAMALGEFARVA